MFVNWELDEDTSEGCPVPDTVPAAPLETSCTMGSLAPYIVNATTPEDIVKSVKFASAYNLRLRVKNTGHDYTGRSSAPGSFTIWTRHLDHAEFLPDFRPAGCTDPSDDVPLVVAAGPGVTNLQLYQAGEDFNVTMVGGFAISVGITGGAIIGGATGPLSPKFGLGVDNVVQYDVVLANGTLTSASACQNTDLFWAMRGGGGVFGVHTKAYIRAHPALQAVNTVSGLFKANDTTSYAALIKKLVDLQPKVHSNGLYGIWETSYPIVAYLNVQPFGQGDAVVAPTEMFKLFDEIRALPGVSNTLKAGQSVSWNAAYHDVVMPTIDAGSAVGVNCADISRIISNELISTQTGRDQISDFILKLPQVPFIFQLVAGGAVNLPGPTDTPVNPAWRDAFAFMDVPTFGHSSGVVDPNQRSTVLAVSHAADAVFGTNSYYNEEYPNRANWQEYMFGPNYNRLLRIKKEVDPNYVFSCRHCVASEYGH